MLISLLILLLISNAVTLRQDKSILFSRIAIVGLISTSFLTINNFFIKPLEKGIGIYGGLFNVTTFTNTLIIFIFIISATILTLTAFFPRKVYNAKDMETSYLIFLLFFGILPPILLAFEAIGIFSLHIITLLYIPVLFTLLNKTVRFSSPTMKYIMTIIAILVLTLFVVIPLICFGFSSVLVITDILQPSLNSTYTCSFAGQGYMHFSVSEMYRFVYDVNKAVSTHCAANSDSTGWSVTYNELFKGPNKGYASPTSRKVLWGIFHAHHSPTFPHNAAISLDDMALCGSCGRVYTSMALDYMRV